MRQTFALSILCIIAVAPVVIDAAESVGAILHDAATANGGGRSLGVTGYTIVTYSVAGTFEATVNFEGSADGTRYQRLDCVTLTGVPVSSAATEGTWRCHIAGLTRIRGLISRYRSGVVRVSASALTPAADTLQCSQLEAVKIIVVTCPPYDAKGDGRTDDTGAIRRAYRALPRGGILMFPPGIFPFAGLTIDKPIILRGAGGSLTESATVLKYTGNGVSPAIIINDIAARGMVLEDFQLFDGGSGTVGIEINTQEPRLSRVYIYNTTATEQWAGWTVAALRVGGSQQVNDLLVRDVYIRAIAGDCLQLLEVSEATIDHSRFVNCRGAGIRVGSATKDTNNLNIVNGTSIASGRVAGSRGLDIVRAPLRLSLRDCYFESDRITEANNYAISMRGAVIAENVIIDGCYFTGNEWGAAADYAIDANMAALRLAVRNTYFTNFTVAAIKNSTAFSIRADGNILAGGTPAIVSAFGANTVFTPQGLVTFNRSASSRRTAPTDGAAVALDASLVNQLDVAVTDGAGFMVANPTNATEGQRITITIRNIFGAMGTVTWDTLYKLAPWTNPGHGSSRSIHFTYDGVNWIEVARTPADVPN